MEVFKASLVTIITALGLDWSRANLSERPMQEIPERRPPVVLMKPRYQLVFRLVPYSPA